MWYFYSPIVVFGEDALDHLETIEGKKCFIVTDPGIKSLGLLDILTEKLAGSGKAWEVFADVEPDPREETVYVAAEQCKMYNPDLIIGIGGGSSLDTAKAVWVLYEHPEFTSVDEIHPFQNLNTGKKAQLIAIPTTSGTGAETTWAVVITRTQEGRDLKLEQGNKGVIPTFALVDPVFTRGMPPGLTAGTGFDALAHSVECLISTWQNVFSDALAIEAIRLILEYLPEAVHHGDNMKARELLHDAASMGGLAFGNAQVTLGHAMAHALGAVFHIPHGTAVGLCLPYAMEYCIRDPESSSSTKRVSLAAKSVGVAHWSDEDTKAADKLVEKVKWLQKETGLPPSLQALGISQEDLDENMDHLITLCMESASTVMTPRSIGVAEFRKLFEYMYSGRNVDF
ncbi:MAG: iron-containing alcohol dehydrogenase [Theionarchaea archaeon]|nr:iron-containing alcohol dehydrogenase [Theionarchaea archaeon]MBU7001152.1 iron-containing alcohol dehydrogenase [Theionarchaea archaeon]MBU7019931.1 iron-containing alcohol dehydrogenase [Theionarchaea archaeon]